MIVDVETRLRRRGVRGTVRMDQQELRLSVVRMLDQSMRSRVCEEN